jgi:hypothetical protein
MVQSKPPVPYALESLASEIDAALDLLKGLSLKRDAMIKSSETPASLLDQCVSICAQQRAIQRETIRTVHHVACTGGTLISKCIAAMPNTQLLSEVDPLSNMDPLSKPGKSPTKPLFAPTDMVKLMRQSTRGVSDEIVIELFLNNLEIIYSEAVKEGQRLVLRDHAHSHFCMGSEIPVRPSLSDILAYRFPVQSVVTVRHPIDSYLSLKAFGWVQYFSPATFDEYCRRYVAFIRSNEGVPIVRFEDFVSTPLQIMQDICTILDLPFNEQFMDLFSANKLSGDSGRSGDIIEPRPRREMGADVGEEFLCSKNYGILNNLLQYD